MYNLSIKRKERPQQTRPPIEDGIRDVSSAKKAIRAVKDAPQDVQDRVHSHIKENFPDVLIERNR